MTLRELKAKVDKELKTLEGKYGEGADVNVVVLDATGHLNNNVHITIEEDQFMSDDNVTTFMHPQHLNRKGNPPKAMESKWTLAEITYG